MTPLWPTQQIQLRKLCSKAQTYSGVPGDLEFERLWLHLKGISIKKLHRQIVLPNSYNNHTQNIRVVAQIGDFIVEYLRKFEAICKKNHREKVVG
jgi:hypothetical protein